MLQRLSASLVKFKSTLAGAISRVLADKLTDTVSLLDFGAKGDGLADDTAAILLALGSGRKVIDGLGLTYKVSASVTVPDGVTFKDAKLVNTKVGSNVVLFSSNSLLFNIEVVGTNTTNVVERGFYPAHDGVTKAKLQVAASRLTVGLQLCPINNIIPDLNDIEIVVSDIVGETGLSEGYGALLSPASRNKIVVRAKDVQRHALYLSAGASYNKCVVLVDGCGHHAVSVYSVEDQDYCEGNDIDVRAVGLKNPEGQHGFAVALGLTQKVRGTVARVFCKSEGYTDAAVKVEGQPNSNKSWPVDNDIEIEAYGTFLGNAIAYSADADNTVFRPTIIGKSANSLVQFTDASGNTYNPKRAGAVSGGTLDGIDGTLNGIAVTSAKGVVDVHGGIVFSNVSQAVADYTNKRVGVNRSYKTKVRGENIDNNSYKRTSFTVPFSLKNISVRTQVESASTMNDQVHAVVSSIAGGTIDIDLWNRTGNTQSVIEAVVWVDGD